MSDLFFDISVKFEFGSQQRQRLYIKLAQLLRNGVSLDIALQQLERISKRGKSKVMGNLYGRWRRQMANGKNFGACVAPYVPSAEAMLIETGANSGKLIDSLTNAADAIEQQSKVKKAIITATAYPGVLVGMLIAAMVLSAYQVIPTFEEILPVEQWEGVSYYVAISAGFIRKYGVILTAVSLMTIFVVSFSMPRWTGRTRVFFDGFAPWSLYKMWQGSSFLLAISSLMAAGVKLDENSLARIARKADPYLNERVRAIRKSISAGENLGDALYKSGYKFPDEEIIDDLQIYARLRGFDQNLIRITRVWVDSLVERVNTTMKVVNTIILMLIAVVIGCLISAFYGVFQQLQSQTTPS
jgi:type II secretory pathway component PulF